MFILEDKVPPLSVSGKNKKRFLKGKGLKFGVFFKAFCSSKKYHKTHGIR